MVVADSRSRRAVCSQNACMSGIIEMIATPHLVSTDRPRLVEIRDLRGLTGIPSVGSARPNSLQRSKASWPREAEASKMDDTIPLISEYLVASHSFKSLWKKEIFF